MALLCKVYSGAFLAKKEEKKNYPPPTHTHIVYRAYHHKALKPLIHPQLTWGVVAWCTEHYSQFHPVCHRIMRCNANGIWQHWLIHNKVSCASAIHPRHTFRGVPIGIGQPNYSIYCNDPMEKECPQLTFMTLGQRSRSQRSKALVNTIILERRAGFGPTFGYGRLKAWPWPTLIFGRAHITFLRFFWKIQLNDDYI